MQPKGFTNNTFNPVPANGIPHLARHTDTQTTTGLVTCQVNQGKSATVHPFTTPVYMIKLPCFPEQTGLGEPKPLHPAQAERRLRPLARLLLITA